MLPQNKRDHPALCSLLPWVSSTTTPIDGTKPTCSATPHPFQGAHPTLHKLGTLSSTFGGVETSKMPLHQVAPLPESSMTHRGQATCPPIYPLEQEDR